jgi:hypothetical protein
MKHLSKFEAKRVAEYIRNQYEEVYVGAWMIANQIENYSDKDGMVFHFAVSDLVGKDLMHEIESECTMYVELERA